MDSETAHLWRKCSTCKKAILLGSRYYECSVSTCTSPRTGYVFCSVSCFDSHLPGARHRDAGAIEKVAPKTAEAPPTNEAPRRFIAKSSPSALSNSPVAPKEVLIIASRLKEYITARSDFNTSASVMEVLSEHVRRLCDQAIDQARAEGRKTVLDSDFDFVKSFDKN